jgi:hypothetical protein
MAFPNSFWARDDAGRMAPSPPPGDTVDLDFIGIDAPHSRVVRELAKNGGAATTVTQLVQRTALTEAEVKEALRELRDDQFVSIEGAWDEWCAQLTPDGWLLVDQFDEAGR